MIADVVSIRQPVPKRRATPPPEDPIAARARRDYREWADLLRSRLVGLSADQFEAWCRYRGMASDDLRQHLAASVVVAEGGR
jgi:hypothetical protein